MAWHARRGTTMIELVVVMALFAILSTMAVIRMRPSPKLQVEQNARLLAQDLDQARTRAYSSRVLTRMVLRDSTWNLYIDQNADSVLAENAVERTAFGGVATRALESQVRFGRGAIVPIPTDSIGATWLPASVARITFSPRGTTEPFGSSTVIYLRHQGDATAVAAIEVTPSANVRVWRRVQGIWQ